MLMILLFIFVLLVIIIKDINLEYIILTPPKLLMNICHYL